MIDANVFLSYLFPSDKLEAATILDISLRQTLEIVEKKIGGNVGRDEACRALELAKKLAEK